MTSKRNPTGVIRTAFALEAAANIFGAACMLAFPHQILKSATPSTLLHQAPTAMSKTLLHWTAGLVLGLTPQLLLALPDTPRAMASRWMVYTTLLSGEVALVGLMAWQGVMKDESAVGMSNTALWLCGLNLGIISVWRVYAMVAHPEWFEGAGLEANVRKDQ